MNGFIVQLPRWMLLAALALAPWAYGATRSWTVDLLDALLGSALTAWAIGWAMRKQWPSFPPALALVSVLLAFQAWWMTLNAKYDYDPLHHTFIGLEPLLDWAPGSFHRALSFRMAIHITVMLGAGCLACELASRPVWRRRILWTMAVTGISLTLFGLIQRMARAPSIFWSGEYTGDSFFATYRYHSNAGAFINLIWPIAAGFLVASFSRADAGREKAFWGAGLVLCLAGMVVNASRAATVLGLILAGLWMVWMVVQSLRGRWEGINPVAAVVTLGLLFLLIAAVALLAGLDVSARRWAKFDKEFTTDNPRLVAVRVCLDMLGVARSSSMPPESPRAGWWGFGPGTFPTIFPYFTNELGDKIKGVWLEAHQDYLQTLVEWGYGGGMLWAVFIFGGVAYSWKTILRRRQRLSLREEAIHFGIFAGILGVLLHALVDFPLQIASIQLYFVVFLGFLWASRDWMGQHSRQAGEGEERAAGPD